MDKLQELTKKLYNEGLSKGREEGQAILENARAQAETILEEARQQADEIIEKARGEAEDLRSKTESDIKMASAQALGATRKDIEDLVIGKIAGEPTKEALASPDFLKEVIKAVASRFSAEQSEEISLVLPEGLRAQLEPFVKDELTKLLSKEVNASFSKKLAGGFTIGPKDGSYFISLSDESFKSLISEYLRPAARKLLFG